MRTFKEGEAVRVTSTGETGTVTYRNGGYVYVSLDDKEGSIWELYDCELEEVD